MELLSIKVSGQRSEIGGAREDCMRRPTTKPPRLEFCAALS
jgi:hypothetical protein